MTSSTAKARSFSPRATNSLGSTRTITSMAKESSIGKTVIPTKVCLLSSIISRFALTVPLSLFISLRGVGGRQEAWEGQADQRQALDVAVVRKWRAREGGNYKLRQHMYNPSSTISNNCFCVQFLLRIGFFRFRGIDHDQWICLAQTERWRRRNVLLINLGLAGSPTRLVKKEED